MNNPDQDDKVILKILEDTQRRQQQQHSLVNLNVTMSNNPDRDDKEEDVGEDEELGKPQSNRSSKSQSAVVKCGLLTSGGLHDPVMMKCMTTTMTSTNNDNKKIGVGIMPVNDPLKKAKSKDDYHGTSSKKGQAVSVIGSFSEREGAMMIGELLDEASELGTGRSGSERRLGPRQPARPGAFACAGTSTSTTTTTTTPTTTGGTGDLVERGGPTATTTSPPQPPQPRPPTPTATATGTATGGGAHSDDGLGVDNNGLLATANPVEELSLPFARAQDDNDNDNNNDNKHKSRQESNQKLLLFGAVGLAIVIVIVIVMTSVLLKGESTKEQHVKESSVWPTASPSMAPSQQGVVLLDLLPQDTVEAIHSNLESPQAKAFQWLMEDPTWTTYPSQRLVQRFALATLYFSSGGSTSRNESTWFHHDNWLSYKHECDWWSRETVHEDPWNAVDYDPQQTSHGSVCNSYDDGMYEHLWLWENQFEGSLPEELYSLTSLRSIYIVNNGELSGTLSTRIGHLTNLEALGLYTNALTGSIPTQVGLLTNLQSLGLYGNQLTGIVPTQLGGLNATMKYVLLDGNQLTGPIPSQLGRLQQVLTLFLDTNLLSSQIPSELGQMKVLQEFATDENQLTGPIPSQLGVLEKLWMLHLADNKLTSTIPSDIGNLSNLNACVLRYNQLTGSIPTELGKLESVWSIDLLSNELTGRIPTQFGLLSTYRGEEPSDPFGTTYQYRNWIIPSELHLNANHLSGQIPSQLGLLGAINVVSLQDNQLSGELPTQLGLLRALTAPYNFPGQPSRPGLSVKGNANITGPIPSELGNLAAIAGLDLSNCTLTGGIPSQLAQLSSAGQLSLANNQLTGTVPPELATLALNASLLVLDLSGNDLSGTIPTGLCFLEKEERNEASSLDFDCNSSLLCGCHCTCTNDTGVVAVEEKQGDLD